MNKTSILIPYISQDNISHIYYQPIFKNGKFCGSNYFSSGLYEYKKEENNTAFAVIAEPLLLYDEVYITIDDFLYLTTKINDVDVLIDLIENGTLIIIDTESFRFANYYDKNSSQFRILTDRGQKGKSGFISQYDALPEHLLKSLKRNVLKVENEDVLINKIFIESNNDLLDKRIISNLEFDGKVSMQGVSYDDYKRNRLFYLNYFLNLQYTLGIESIFQDRVLYDLLKFKIQMAIPEWRPEDSFFTLLEFNDILDIGSLFINRNLSFEKIIKIRESSECKEFRKWIRNLNIESGISEKEKYDVIKAYHNACIEKGKLEKITDSFTYKGFSLATTSLASVVNPLLGFTISLGDVLKDLVIRKWKPNFFFDHLRHEIKK